MKTSIPVISLLALSPSLAYAEVGSTSFTSFIPLIALVAIFYFLLIRPQQKRAKSHKTLLADLKKGDEVLTNGGVLAKVTKVDAGDTFATIEIAAGVEVKVQKQAINQRMPKGTVDSPKQKASPKQKTQPKQKALPKQKDSAKQKDDSAKQEKSSEQKDDSAKQKESPNDK